MKLPDKTSFTVTLFAIFTNIFVSAQIYALFQNSVTDSSFYNGMEALGSIFMGFLSDKFCRRKTNILSHAIGLSLLTVIIFYAPLRPAIFLLGFFYNPLPILRAGLIDNFTKIPRLYLLMISFVVQFIPWCFYNVFVAIEPKKMLLIAVGLLCLSFLGSLFFFQDKRDKNKEENLAVSRKKILHPSMRTKVLYTFFAFLVLQIVFFCSDNLQETLVDSPDFYSVMSTATALCLLLALVFKDISHVSILRVTYGVNAALSFVPLSALLLFQLPHFDTSYQVLMLASLGAMALPFVYDITMHSTNANYRGTACGILDFVFNIASMFSTSLIVFLNINSLFTYIIIAIGLCLALFLQTKAEKHPNIAIP